jgi:hypothetical protein
VSVGGGIRRGVNSTSFFNKESYALGKEISYPRTTEFDKVRSDPAPTLG